MTVTVQDDTGLVDGANAYIDLVFFKAYHDARGHDYSAHTDPQIEAGIVLSTDYLDTRFQFRGIKLNLSGQSTEWPRRSGSAITMPWLNIDLLQSPIVIATTGNSTLLMGPNGEEISGIPDALEKACAEYALRALAASLFTDAPAPAGGRDIAEITQKVDVIEQSVKYTGGSGPNGTFVIPGYPAADLLLVRAGLIEAGRTLYR